jgi:hypothetical protein
MTGRVNRWLGMLAEWGNCHTLAPSPDNNRVPPLGIRRPIIHQPSIHHRRHSLIAIVTGQRGGNRATIPLKHPHLTTIVCLPSISSGQLSINPPSTIAAILEFPPGCAALVKYGM